MEMDINTVLEELKNSNVDRFDLMPLMTRGIKNKFHPEIYLDNDQIETRETIEHSVHATRQALIERFDTWENAVLYHNIKIKCGNLYLQDDEKGGMCIKRPVKGFSSDYYLLVNLLRYAVLNKFDRDSIETNKITDTMRVKTQWGGFDYVESGEFEVLGLSVRCYKNGKCVIKGLSEDQRARIVDGFALYNKYSVRY